MTTTRQTKELKAGRPSKPKQNGHKPADDIVEEPEQPDSYNHGFITRTRYGKVYYYAEQDEVDGMEDVDGPGIWLKSSMGMILVLGGVINIVPAPISSTRTRNSSITIEVTNPAHYGDRKVIVTITGDRRRWREDYEPLARFVMIPTDNVEYDIVWRALRVMSLEATLRNPGMFPEYADRLGWVNGAWVSVNGGIDSRGVITDRSIVVPVPNNWPQCIPVNHTELPKTVSASTLELLYDFWPRDKTMFATAILGAASYIMNPAHSGTARWQLELVGQTDWGKTTGINHFLRLFMGAGYDHETSTQLVRDDSGPGRRASLHMLQNHIYQDYDYNKHPGQDDYEKQQKERIGKLEVWGNSDRAPAKADMNGNLADRKDQAGLLVRTLEVDPTTYTISKLLASAEARAVTFVLEGSSHEYKSGIRDVSVEIEEHYPELDRISILFKSWLAHHNGESMVRMWNTYRSQAVQMVASVKDSGDYQFSHSRTDEQLYDLVCGLKTFIRFLQDVDTSEGKFAQVIDGGSELASRIEDDIEPLIADRLSYSHNLAIKFAQARGGETQLHAQAKSVMDAIRDALTKGDYYVNDIPDDFLVAKEHLGWEPGTVWDSANIQDKHGNDRTVKIADMGYVVRRGATLLGFIRGEYLYVEDLPFESLVRQYARHDSCITLTTLDRLLSELKSVGATVCDGKYNRHQVRTDSGGRDRKLCFKISTLFSINVSVHGSDSSDNSDSALEPLPKRPQVSLLAENTQIVDSDSSDTLKLEPSQANSSVDVSTMTRSQLQRIVKDSSQPFDVVKAASDRLVEMDEQKPVKTPKVKPVKTPKVVKKSGATTKRKGAN